MLFFYLSQILGQPVRNRHGERVARIKDLVARLEAFDAGGEVALEAYPPVSGLLAVIENREIFIPWQQIQSLGPNGAQLSSPEVSLVSFRRRDGEVLLARDLLDKQLIDIDGRRVIRGNDLQLYQADGTVRVTAVDVSGEALLRRLTFGKLFAARPTSTAVSPQDGPEKAVQRLRRRRAPPAKLINWADIEPLAADVPEVRLRLSHERLAILNPVDIAHILDDLSYQQGAEILESLDDEKAADTLQEMDEERQADFVESMDQERAADILEEMEPDDAADLLADLDEIQAEELLRRMDREEAEDVEELLAYPEDSAGGLMTSEFISVPGRWTVEDTVAFMRTMQEAPDVIDYLYVIEEEDPAANWAELCSEGGGHLLGIVSLRDIVLSPGERRLDELMRTDFEWVTPDDSKDDAARMMAEYNLIALPVLDNEGRMLGIITVDDAMEVLLPERWARRLPRVFS